MEYLNQNRKRYTSQVRAPGVSLTGHNLGRLGATASTGAALESVAGITGQGGGAGAVHGAAAGASIGSVAGPIGAAVGAVVGALAGALIHSSKFPDWLAADTQIIAQMNQLPAGFQGRQLSLLTLTQMYTAVVVTGALYSYVSPPPSHSPSDMQAEFNWIMAWIKVILQAMNAAPVGAPIQLTIPTGNGVTFQLSFTNPGSANSTQVAQTVIIPAYIAWCTHNNAVDVQNCNTDASKPIVQLMLILMTDYSIAQYPPPPSQSSVATTAPAPVVTPSSQATVTVSTPASDATTTIAAGQTSTTMPEPSMAQSTPQVILQAPAPVAPIASSNNTMLYILAGLAGVYLLTKK